MRLRRTIYELYFDEFCRNPEEFKALSQNPGHEGVLTTLSSYGTVSEQRQKEISREMGTRGSEDIDEGLRVLRDFERYLRTRP